MLDQETKRKIDNARDILVGKVPDPKSQVEQITIALIYKFMDDMDKESQELGGKAAFFTGEFEKYTWSRIFDPRLGGFELIALYGEAITKMNQNQNIPQLFRDIFKNAFLPYRDPETLKSFLKEINEFKYDHSEKLGDAFEYLLSVLGSQGDAGQFRTPRHIIDFIVEVVDPKKNETILDPACATAGFLISSYKHILKQNTKERKGDCLTMDERKRLMNSLVGYDISPDMVRLSLVNMYLHGFSTPKIYEYDTLTSEEKWNETYDVILANPPFMTPKGGIRPHKRFSVQANRSEVLFVDYIMEHLTINGRAGVIVPEGIIFQSANAYKALRKLLVDSGYLFAVVSLPQGVFQPYSGVKTCILLMDKSLAKRAQDILFVKIENEGFDLGAQRRAIDKNDFPIALDVILRYKKSLQEGKGCEFSEEESKLAHRVLKTKIAESGDYNLSGDRYKETVIHSHNGWPVVELGKVCVELKSGFACGDSDKNSDGVPHLRPMNISSEGQLVWDGTKYISEENFKDKTEYTLKKCDVLFNNTNSKELVGKTCFVKEDINCGYSNHITRIRTEKSKLDRQFLSLILHNLWEKGTFLQKCHKWVGQAGINNRILSEIKVPLPPLSIQQEIVAEIEGYQKIIDGARQVVENYKPRIKVEEGWEVVELGDVSFFKRGPFGGSLKKEIFIKEGYKVYEQKHAINNDFEIGGYYIDESKYNEMIGFAIKPNDIIISCSGTMGKVAIVPENAKNGIINQALLKITPQFDKISPIFLKTILEGENIQQKHFRNTLGVAIQNVASVKELKKIKIPLPSLDVQKEIVARIEEEQKLVDANKKLIELFEEKIKEKIAEVWG